MVEPLRTSSESLFVVDLQGLDDGQARSIGAVHTGLDRLEAKGLIVSRMGEPTAERGGRAKRMVKVTAAGTQAAADFYQMISVHVIFGVESGLGGEKTG